MDRHYTTSMAHLAARFDAALEWLRDSGVRVDAGRMRVIRDDLAMVVGLPAGHREPLLDADERRVLASLTDAADLGRIHKQYAGRETAPFIDRLAGFASGPPPGEPEGEGSTKKRDVLAELSWGSLLGAGGAFDSNRHAA